MEKSKLLTPDITLNVGDFLLEASTHNENDYRIYKITSIEGDYMRMDLKFDIFKGTIIPVHKLNPSLNISADVSAHYYTEGDAFKTYVLNKNHPYRLLYEKNEE